MKSEIDTLDNMISQFLANQGLQTPEEIRNHIKILRTTPLFPSVTDEEAEKLAREIEVRHGVSMGLGAAVDSQDFEEWLETAQPETGSNIKPWYYWGRYKNLLSEKKLPRDVIYGLDQVTDRILARLGNPLDNRSWARKGMVVGHVQSGKTANFIGLACKAADVGYRLIIVIAGIHNNLRSQTQSRIDEGFIGLNTDPDASRRHIDRRVGVGLHDQRSTPVSLTTTKTDFNKGTANANTMPLESINVPLILVIKKNTRTLENLIDWLKNNNTNISSQLVQQPMLLIDDEADNASINVKYDKAQTSTINRQIRELLGEFHRSCYVGYTATPFANIFIDPDNENDLKKEDLFPKDFIIGLDAPSNYFGPRKIFVEENQEDEHATFLRVINDNEDVLPITHKKDFTPVSLPNSMIYAIRSFIIARTIRDLRNQKDQHASMLVNASRFTLVQGIIRNRIQDELDKIKHAVGINSSIGRESLRDPDIAALHDVWLLEYQHCGFEWNEIQAQFFDSITNAKVVEVNSKYNDLDYPVRGNRGVTVIAVGGFSLSRGLTLEGLTVSYFLRNSKMYDTLMQMGRWFGYRMDYEDLCRIWMPEDAISWYAHIAEATEELHNELHIMQRTKATPLDFGLSVRSHPSSLLVTARNKLGSGIKQVKIGLSNKYIETSKLINTPEVLDSNRLNAKRFYDSLLEDGYVPSRTKCSGGYLLKNVDVNRVIDFLKEFKNSEENLATATNQLCSYIGKRASDELEKWDVLISSVNEDKGKDNSLGWPTGISSRSVGVSSLKNNVLAIGGKNARIASRGIEKFGVPNEDIIAAEIKYNDGDKSVNFPDWIYREKRKRPLLIIFLISVKISENTQNPEMYQDYLPKNPVVAFGISFPESSHPDKTEEYIMNTTMLKEQGVFGEDDQDEEKERNDD